MTELWQIHTLVFDLDDTLYPEREYVLGGFQAVAAWLSGNLKVTDFAESARDLFERGGRGKIFDEALTLHGLQPKPELVTRLVDVYRAHEPKLCLFPDASEILEWAASRYQLALITDGYSAVQARKIRALGLEAIIPCRIITDELGREFWKPSPEPYRRVMAHYPGPAAGCVYVADNPRKDFIGAKQLGWRTVRIRRPGGEHAAYEASEVEAADAEITDLRLLKAMLTPGRD